MTASSSASWSRFSPPADVVNGHVSTMLTTLSGESVWRTTNIGNEIEPIQLAQCRFPGLAISNDKM